MEAGETVVKEGDALRMALTLGTHARLAEHGRNLELAQELAQAGDGGWAAARGGAAHCLDVLWDFVRATDNEDFAEQHHQLTRQVLRESPGYGHANLILVYARQGDKRTAMEHFAKLFFADREVFDLVAQDPTFDDFFEHIGSSSFYKSAPKKGAH
jgi:hypothetical protein